MKFVLATNNAHKLSEFRRMFENLEIEIVSLADIGIDIEVEETGKTFEENSFIKAEAISKLVDCPVIADDSGLCVQFLDNAPGVLSQRFGGDISQAEKNKLLLSKLEDAVDLKQREAYFECVITAVFKDNQTLVSSGRCYGTIGFEERGENGFGYDPIFYVGEKSLAQLSDVEKDRISHRGNALKDFYKKLKDKIN